MPKVRSKLSKKTPASRRVYSSRLHENQEESKNRLSRMSLAQSSRIFRENSAERELRLLQKRTQIAERRQRQSSPERMQQLECQRLRSARNRTQHSDACNSGSAFAYNPEIDYLNLKDIKIGNMDKICEFCNAKKWIDEAPGLCCAGGKVVLPDLEEPPEPIRSLILGSHPLSKQFLDQARSYNTQFQMTSFGANEVRDGNFMPTFKVQGQVYHSIGTLFPTSTNNPQFLQIYFISDADQVSLRSNIISNLDRQLTALLQKVLQKYNNYIKSFKYNIENSATDNFKLIIHADRVPANEHRGRYNAPTTNEVAVLLVDEDKGPRDIVLHSRDGKLQRVSELHRSYDPLQYPLMFVRGEDGYCLTIPQHNTNRNQARNVSCMQFYAYRLMVRGNSINHLHYFKNLFNQYCVDMMAKMISERLHFIRYNQNKLRADEYIHLRDAFNRNDANINPADMGQQVILPSSFTGSPRYMQEKTQDAMTYVRKYGRPDLFLTFTCNPEWPEIKNELFPGQKSANRHDIIARVFQLKMKKLMGVITKNVIFGPVRCYMLSVEWQKRGLPHCHVLLWLETKIQPDKIDDIICAEIPDKKCDPLLYEIVCKNMIHGPCGEHNMSSPCMNNGKCTKKFPRNFIRETQTGDDGFPTYRRRAPEDGGYVTTLKTRGHEVSIDNRWVVPFCPMLARCFSAHINVEYCHSVQAIKYICKYINKGSDKATFFLHNKNDEVDNYLNGRYISTSEAAWRFFDFPIHQRFPPVQHLAVHLENGQRIYFTADNIRDVIENPRKTTLTAFFDLCRLDDFARTLLYQEVPSYYIWCNNKFSRRKRGQDVEGHPGIKKDSALGRVYNIHPNQTECFHLRMLLHHVRGPTSYHELRTVNDVIHPTFQAACRELGLLESDDHWKDALTDAAVSQSPSKLRELFAIILVFCQPSQPTTLWELFQQDFCADILHRERLRLNDVTLQFSDDIFNQGLIEIEDKVIALSDKNLVAFTLPSPTRNQENAIDPYAVTLRHPYDTNKLKNYVRDNLPKLIHDQRLAFDSIIDSVSNNRGNVFFVDAPGGTGKTFLINLLLAEVRSTGKLALAVASSGIAATLLSGGRTAHSTFKLPLNVSLQQDVVCSIRKNSALGKVIQETTFIVCDECTMIHRAHMEAIDRTLRDIRSSNKLMGGVTFVFAGDFRQTLPVITKGTRADIVKACLKSSRLWNCVEKLNLRTNMRAHLGGGDTDFPLQLLRIGDGDIPNDNGSIIINDKIGKIISTVNNLIDEVYPDIKNLSQKSYHWLCERAIVSPRNASVEEINNIILEKFEGESRQYRSIDTVIEIEDAVHYPQEFLNSLEPAGFPPHNLKLKVGTPIMLLRNLNPPNLCNGTRLQVKVMKNNIIEAIILTGPAAGELACIPRIPMIPTDLPFQFKRLQFPLKVSFAITINKSQGQTFKFVGVDLRLECFSHGQLYVALSRTGNANNQFILIPNGCTTKNIIYPEVL